MEIGPDNNLYLIIGDFHGYQNRTTTLAQNYKNGTFPDGRAGILRLTQDGKPIKDGILGKKYPLNLYYAYGIRNGYGLDFDPVSGKLWDTENGPDSGDEINLVNPGFNSGWNRIQGISQDKVYLKLVKLCLDTQKLGDFEEMANTAHRNLFGITTAAPTGIPVPKFNQTGRKIIKMTCLLHPLIME